VRRPHQRRQRRHGGQQRQLRHLRLTGSLSTTTTTHEQRAHTGKALGEEWLRRAD
jgi:hypothetical protein